MPRAQLTWSNAPEATDRHPYLKRKQVPSHGLRLIMENLLVPLYDNNGTICSLQTISPDGDKSFFEGCYTTGYFFEIANTAADDQTTIGICEGYATGASVHGATGHRVFVAFSNHNMLPVAKIIRERYPDADIILCADDDGKDGIKWATKAAQAIGGLVAVPVFGENRKDNQKDFNDMIQAVGSEAVKRTIDEAVEPGAGSDTPKPKAKASKQADILMRIASDEAEFFHSRDDIGYADLDISGHRETWPIRSKGFRRWLLRRFYQDTGRAPNSESMSTAINVIEARAHYDGQESREVFLRVASDEGRLYLDLCNDVWQVVEIDDRQWRVIDDAPVRFLRRPGMLALPEPTKGGSIKALRQYANIHSTHDFILTVAWLLAALRHSGSYPVLDLTGEQGSAKSTLAKLLRALVDPVKAPVRAPPRDNRDLFIAASNSHLVAYDNLSSVPDWLSDTLCRLATGGGFSTRQLYTDDDEKLFDAVRPVILGSISNVIERGDLADRSISVVLPIIVDADRRSEAQLMDEFEQERPAILGALLGLMTHGLRMLPRTQLKRLPRMADFVLWATACLGQLYPAGKTAKGNPLPTFGRAYALNRATRSANILEGDLVAVAVQSLMTDQELWSGTTTELLHALDHQVDDRQRDQKTWPKAANSLSSRLTRAAPDLRRVGIDITAVRDSTHDRRKTITITKTTKPKSTGKSSSTSSDHLKPNKTKELGSDDGVEGASFISSDANLLKNHNIGRSDDVDDGLHSLSATRKFRYRPNKAATERRVRNAQYRGKRQ